MLVGTSATGVPVYLRDLRRIWRGYQSPPAYLNYLPRATRRARGAATARSPWPSRCARASRSPTFGEAVDAAIAGVRPQLPPDLIVARTSDQPRQVDEHVDPVHGSLYEAIVLVVLVALIGFWEWRAALLMAPPSRSRWP